MEDVKKYLETLLPTSSDWAKELETYAEKEHVPIMDKQSMTFLMQLVRIVQPNKILEIGAAIGYSALRMHEAYPEAKIITIEKDEKRYDEAIRHIRSLHKQEAISVLKGDPNDNEHEIAENGPFDIVFIDAAKKQYKRFFELCNPYLRRSGIIVSDNVLFRGYVADPKQAGKRLEKIATSLQDYNQWLMDLKNFHTSFIPIGDGIAISYKTSKELK